MNGAAVNYDDWIKSVPQDITQDVLWTVKAYQYALFISDLCWSDVTKLMQDKRTLDLSDQLYRAIGSISANIAEGYSRSTGKDRARFYEYALGSARESRDWYYKARYALSENAVQHRSGFLTEIIRLLITMVPQQRQSRSIREEGVNYEAGTGPFLNSIPMP
jgi:four helix bundle protein